MGLTLGNLPGFTEDYNSLIALEGEEEELS